MLPKQLKILGSSSYSAIYGMTKLKEIVVPQSVTVLGGEFSRDCGSLERIIIYGKVVTANVRMGYALQHLNFLVLPDTISSISHNDAFSRTYALTTIICNAATPPALANNNLFAYAGAEQVIYIPDDSVSDYSAGQYWGNYTSRFKTFSQLREEHPDWYEAYVVKA